MKSIFVLRLILPMIAALIAGGCASYSVSPAAASINAPKARAPIPAVVGINHVEQNLQGSFPDMVRSVQQSLTDSQLFKEVYYPMRSTDRTDGQISLRLSSTFKMDGALFPKSFFTGFFLFLPAPIVTYQHHYLAECRLELFKGDRLIKAYSANADVKLVHKLLAPAGQMERESVDATVKLLGSNLVKQLVADRDFIEKALVLPATP